MHIQPIGRERQIEVFEIPQKFEILPQADVAKATGQGLHFRSIWHKEWLFLTWHY
jgi:hypothetical protein